MPRKRLLSLDWEHGRSTAIINAQRQLESLRERLSIRPSTPDVSKDNAAGWLNAIAPDAALPPVEPSPPTLTKNEIRLFPDLALGMLRQELTAPGRIWLLLRHLDQMGRGWVDVSEAREQLTRKQAPLRVCGQRQLRNLLHQGENLFWRRDGERIWLKSTAKTAVSLNISRLRQQPVAIPVSALLQGIGSVRAHLYASFHSARVKKTRRGQAAPIARATLTEISGLNARTQRNYERETAVRAKPNYAIGSTIKNSEEQAWRHGRAAFPLKDTNGRQGKAGTTYLAWQLPNSYIGPHALKPRGRQKRINRELEDLFMKGMTGNDKTATVDNAYRPRRFYESAKKAAKTPLANGHANAGNAYWRSGNNTIWYSQNEAQK